MVPMSLYHDFVSLQGRGVVQLPADVRRRLHLNEPGAQVEVTEREDGVLELRPAVPVPSDQAWFWTERWQRIEREVDEHFAAGRITTHDSGEAFLTYLDELSSDDEQ